MGVFAGTECHGVGQWQRVLSLSNVGKSATIATGQLPDGMYIVTVQAAGQSYYRKLLKSSK